MTPSSQQQIIERELNQYQKALELDSTALPVRVSEMVDCIHERIFDPNLTVATVLDECCIRSNTYSRQFKLAMVRLGYEPLTVREYIGRRRMEAAEKLLKHQELDLILIALHVGYDRYGRFLRTCKRHLGYPPSEYRANCVD